MAKKTSSQTPAPDTTQETPKDTSEVKPVVGFEKDYFELLKASGLDVFARGFWQRKYAHFIAAAFDIRWKSVLDLGCAAGANTSAFAEFTDKLTGVDISEYCKENTKFDNFKFIRTCASNLKDIPDNSIDFVHAHDLFNLVPENKRLEMFREIARVCKNGAILFSIQKLSSVKKKDEQEIVYPKYMWDEMAAEVGMKDGTKSYFDKIMKLPVSVNMMREYNWNYLVYKIVK